MKPCPHGIAICEKCRAETHAALKGLAAEEIEQGERRADAEAWLENALFDLDAARKRIAELEARHEKLLSESERVLPKAEQAIDDLKARADTAEFLLKRAERERDALAARVKELEAVLASETVKEARRMVESKIDAELERIDNGYAKEAHALAARVKELEAVLRGAENADEMELMAVARADALAAQLAERDGQVAALREALERQCRPAEVRCDNCEAKFWTAPLFPAALASTAQAAADYERRIREPLGAQVAAIVEAWNGGMVDVGKLALAIDSAAQAAADFKARAKGGNVMPNLDGWTAGYAFGVMMAVVAMYMLATARDRW